MTPQDKLTKAKIGLLFKHPFFAMLVYGLRYVEDRRGICRGTMATDGVTVYWDRNFVASLDVPELETVLCHEAAHCFLLHMLRRGNRDMIGWNIAIDHAANLLLDDCQPAFTWPLAFPALKDPQFKGMSAEEIYSRLPKLKQGGGGTGKGAKGARGSSKSGAGSSQQPSPQSGGMGDVLDGPGDQSERQQLEEQWKVNVLQAAKAAKMQGKLPAGMERYVEDLLNPKTPWQEVLRRFVRSHAKDDYSWARPNRRYAHCGFILPSLHSQRLGRIAIAIDTSGSIGPDMLNLFLSEVEKIAHECRPEKIVLIDCDAEVNSMREFEATDSLPREFKGGGGTSHVPVFEALEQDPPDVLICLTDLYTSFPDAEPGYSTIWAVYGGNEAKAPFGETITVGE